MPTGAVPSISQRPDFYDCLINAVLLIQPSGQPGTSIRLAARSALTQVIHSFLLKHPVSKEQSSMVIAAVGTRRELNDLIVF